MNELEELYRLEKLHDTAKAIAAAEIYFDIVEEKQRAAWKGEKQNG